MSDVEIGTTGWDALNELHTFDEVPTWAHKFIAAGMREIEAIRAELAAANEQLERERMCHAGCGVIAMANTREALANVTAGIHPDYLSASVQDCIRSVTREIELREQLAALQAQVAQGVADDVVMVPRNSFGLAICALAYAVTTYPDDPCGFNDAYEALNAVAESNAALLAAKRQKEGKP